MSDSVGRELSSAASSQRYCLQPSQIAHGYGFDARWRTPRFEAIVNTPCSTLFPLRETTIGYRALPGTISTLRPLVTRRL